MRAIVAKRVDSGSADLSELQELAAAAGYTVVDELTQTRTEDPAFCFGEGKVEQLAERVAMRDADTVIIDNEVGPFQMFNIGQTLPADTEVLDRFTLILDIFGQRAQTRKAQLQVELAELRYELPRASAKASLAKRDERPGFMGLGEYDESRERDIKAQISNIKDELDSIANKEAERRAERRESGFDLVALAGYTNAGKSTLLNALTNANVLAEDRLFATLDPTTRRVTLPGGTEVLLTDTVGFIQKLPTSVVAAFRATLEEIDDADLLLHVVDVTHPNAVQQAQTVGQVLDELHIDNRPTVVALNKIDLLPSPEEALELAARHPHGVAISAEQGLGIEQLMARLELALAESMVGVAVCIPYEQNALVALFHRQGIVESEEYDPVGTRIEGYLPRRLLGSYARYATSGCGAWRGAG